MENGRLTWTRQ
jgi:hypothetical protein